MSETLPFSGICIFTKWLGDEELMEENGGLQRQLERKLERVKWYSNERRVTTEGILIDATSNSFHHRGRDVDYHFVNMQIPEKGRVSLISTTPQSLPRGQHVKLRYVPIPSGEVTLSDLASIYFKGELGHNMKVDQPDQKLYANGVIVGNLEYKTK